MAEKLYILPYLRKGLSGFITPQEGYMQGQHRAQIEVSVELKGKNRESGKETKEDLGRKIQLVGPADVKRVNESAISQVFPPSSKSQRYNAFNMPFVEFYEEDFPWRYTPLAPDANGSLVPWLMLVAVKKGEFSVETNTSGVKVVTFNLSDERYAEVFPSMDLVKKLAHVQLILDDSVEVNNAEVNKLLEDNPEKGIARILCASKIPTSENISVFLLPVFESGRCGGLGESVNDLYLDDCAVEKQATVFPVYYQWSFYTSSAGGTFEDLADKLEFTSDEEYEKLSSNLTVDIANSGLLVTKGTQPDSNGEIVIDVPAALKLKQTGSQKDSALKEEDTAYRNKLKEELLKSPMFAENSDSSTEDPWVVPPVYGAMHLQATKDDLDGKGKNPVIKEANLELKNRIASGMGSAVVRNNQESFVNRAWQKVEKINELNQIIREYCQMVEVNKTAETRRKVTFEKSCERNISVLHSDAVIRVLNNSKRFRKNVSVESLRKKIEDIQNEYKNQKKNDQVQYKYLYDLDNCIGLRSRFRLTTKTSSSLIDFLRETSVINSLDDQEIKDLLLELRSMIIAALPKSSNKTAGENNVSYEPKKGSRQQNFTKRREKGEKVVKEEITDGFTVIMVEETESDVLDSLDIDRDTLTKLLGRMDTKTFQKKVLNLAQLVSAWLKEYSQKAAKSKIESYSDVMVPKKKRSIGITKAELDSLVSPSVWREVMDNGTRIQKVATQRSEEFMRSNPWLNGLVDIVYENKRFYFIRSRNSYTPTVNYSFINENCTELIMAARGDIKPKIDRQTYGRYAQIAKEAAQVKNDIFTANYTMDENSSASDIYYPLQLDLFKIKDDEYKTVGHGYVVDDKIFAKIAKQFGEKNSGKPIVIYYNSVDEETSAVDTNKDKQGKIYIFPSSYNGITYCKEYRFNLDDTFCGGTISYQYKDGNVTNVSDTGNFDTQSISRFLVEILWKAYADKFPDLASINEFWSNLMVIQQTWLLKPTLAMVEFEENSTKSNVNVVTADNIQLNDTDGELYEKLANKLDSLDLKWANLKEQVADPEHKDVIDIKQEETERINEIIEKYKDVEENQLSDWEEFVKSGAVNSKYPVMAYPEYLEPTFFYLKELAREYILPSAGEMRSNTITIMNTNPKFEEAFLLGMNTEMGQELLWREYPTDQRGAYFRKFWDQTSLPEKDELENKYYDIEKINKWSGSLGSNHKGSKDSMIVFAIKGELMRAYPKTKIYLSTISASKHIEVKYEAGMTSWLSDDTYLVGFQGVKEKMLSEDNLCLTFQEEMSSIVFTDKQGLDDVSNSAAYASKAQDRASIFVLPL